MTDTPTIQPTGIAAVTAGISIFFCIASTITLFLRIWVRISIKALGMDDYLMIIGWAFFVACATFSIMDCWTGLGSLDTAIAGADSTGILTMNGYKYFWCFQVTYVLCLPFIKASICVALLRLTKSKRYVYPLWAVIVVSTGTAFAGLIGAMLNCRPIAAGWDSSLGSCDQTGTIQRLSEVISAAAIVTDWACALLPAFLIWGLNMRQGQKLSVCGILALGVIASISTIIRFPNLKYYAIYTDQLYHFGYIVLWTIIECGLGIVAGSLPSLRLLLKKFGLSSTKSKTGRTTDDPSKLDRSVNLVSIKNKPKTTFSGRNDDWEQIDDSSSQKFIIMKHTQTDVEWDAQTQKGHDVIGNRPL